MSTDYRAFRGVWIPAEVWLAQDMTLQEKVMLVEINSLQHPERGCYKSNRALAEFFGLSVSRVSEVISSLAAKGIVRVETIRKGKQVVERRIFMTYPFGIPNTPPSGKAMNPFGKGDEPPSGKAKESNTSLRGSYEEEKTRVRACTRPDDVDEEVWADYMAIRKAKRAPITQTALSRIRSEAAKAGVTMQQALETCCERGWQSFRADWIANTKQTTPQAGGQVGTAVAGDW